MISDICPTCESIMGYEAVAEWWRFVCPKCNEHEYLILFPPKEANEIRQQLDAKGLKNFENDYNQDPKAAIVRYLPKKEDREVLHELCNSVMRMHVIPSKRVNWTVDHGFEYPICPKCHEEDYKKAFG